jgi:dTDP-4-dehydrorhamnose reductase
MSHITEPSCESSSCESASAARGPVVVLGSTGTLGQALMRVGAERGCRVVGYSRHTQPALELSDVDGVARALDALEPALVINAAACTNLQACEADPAAATDLHAHLPGQLAMWGRTRRRPWVQISTDHYWCGGINRLHHEEEAVSPPNAYALSKRAGEVMALADPGALVLRTNVVGYRGWAGRPNFAEWALAALESGEPFDAYTDVWASSIEAHQLAQALFDLVEHAATGLVHVAARESTSKIDFIRALARACGLDPALARPVQRPQAARLRRANTMGLDVARAEVWLGRRLPTAAEVIGALAARRPAPVPDVRLDSVWRDSAPSPLARTLETTVMTHESIADIEAAKEAARQRTEHHVAA